MCRKVITVMQIFSLLFKHAFYQFVFCDVYVNMRGFDVYTGCPINDLSILNLNNKNPI